MIDADAAVSWSEPQDNPSELEKALRALRIPEASIAMVLDDTPPKKRPPLQVINGGLCKVRMRDGSIKLMAVINLIDGHYIDVDRTALLVKAGRDEPDNGKQAHREEAYRIFGPDGAPEVLKCRCPKGRPGQEYQAPGEVEHLLRWRFSDGTVTDAEWYSGAGIRRADYADRFGVPIAGTREIALYAKLILAQRRAFNIPVERPVRHSGFFGADEAPAYVLKDGRILRPGGILHSDTVEIGTIAGDVPLLQPERRGRWQRRFQTLPSARPTEDQLRETANILLQFDPKGRALCGALLGVRALFYSLVPMHTTVLLTGFRGTAKSTISAMMHWAEGPHAAADEPDMSFRTTLVGGELSNDRARDCVFVWDDGERERPEPGSPLKPDVIRIISDNTRAAFGGNAFKVRGTKYIALQQQRHVQQLHAFSTETAIGLEESLLARQIWWTFEQGEVNHAPLLAPDFRETETWIFGQETITAAGHEMLRRTLERWIFEGRPAAAEFISRIDKEASELASQVELGGKVEDRPRVMRGLAMIIASGILCDIATGDDTTTMQDLALHYGAALAREQLERLAHGKLATAGFDRDWFRPVHDQFVRNGAYLLFAAETGEFIRSADQRDGPEVMGRGYRWDERWVPGAKVHGGWWDRKAGEDWLITAQFLAECHRRARSLGTVFPFNEKTLPPHLLKIGLTIKGNQGSTHKPYIPFSDPRYPDKGSQPRVFRIPIANAEDIPEPIGRNGRSGEPQISDCNISTNDLPVSPDGFSRFSQHREKSEAPIGRRITDSEQDVTVTSPDLPVLPMQNGVYTEFSPENSEPIGNIENPLRPNNPVDLTERPGYPRASHDPQKTSPESGRRQVDQEPPAPAAQKPAQRPEAAPPASDSQTDKGPSASAVRARPPIDDRRSRRPARTAATARTAAGRDQLVFNDHAAFRISAAGTVDPDPELFDAMRPGISRPEMQDLAETAGIDQLVLERSYCHAAGWPQEPNPDSDHPRTRQALKPEGIRHPWAELPDGCGWESSNNGMLQRAMWAYRPGRRGNSIEILLPGYDSREHMKPLSEAPNAECLAHMLNEYRNSTATDKRAGFPLRKSAPDTFHRILRSLSNDHQRDRRIIDISELQPPADYPEPAHATHECVADLSWSRSIDTLSDAERAAPYLAIIDGNCQYMRQFGSIDYGLGETVSIDRPRELAIPGWYFGRYSAPGWPTELPAPGWPLAPGEDSWLVAETIAFLHEKGCQVEIDRASQWSGKGRALNRLSDRLIGAYNYLIERAEDTGLPAPIRSGAELAIKLFKGGYKAGIGQFSEVKNRDSTDPIFEHRPHWRHAIIAASTAGILRDLHGIAQRTGLFPVAIATDGLAFLTNEPDTLIERLGLRRGRAIGCYKHQKTRDADLIRDALARRSNVTDPAELLRLNGEIASLITGTGRTD